jgi:hypothetical protein
MDCEKIKNELKSRIDKFEEKDLQEFNQYTVDYTLIKDNIICKENLSENFISQNTDLFKISTEISDPCTYYLLIFSKPKYKLYNITVNGNIKWKDLSEKLLAEPNSFTFFNIRNIVLYNTSDNKLRSHIVRMFTTRNIVFQDWDTKIESLIRNCKLDIIFFTSRQFYKLSVKNILHVNEDIPDYFKCTNIEDRKVKCDLCQSKNYTYVLEKDFVLNDQFNKFCKECAELIHKLPTTNTKGNP